MANNKVGLDYFELDCQLEEKVRLIQAEFGLKGFAVVVKLYQKIYGEFGYYCEWNEDSLLLFMSENGVSSRNEKNLISDIVAACIRRNIFSEEIFVKYGVLTSVGVQKRYLKATSRRENVKMKKEYLLLSDGKINSNVNITDDSVDIIGDNVCRIGQSRVEESKYNNIIVSASKKADAPDAQERQNSFEKYEPSEFDFWCVGYLIKCLLDDLPNQRVPRTDAEKKKWAVHIERMQRIDGLNREQIRDTLIWAMQDEFWRTNIRSTGKFREKYQTLYLQSRRKCNRKKNTFNDFKQNDYDFGALEEELLSN